MRLLLANDPWFASKAPLGWHLTREGEIVKRTEQREIGHEIWPFLRYGHGLIISIRPWMFFWLHEKWFPFLTRFLGHTQKWNSIVIPTFSRRGFVEATVRSKQGNPEKMARKKAGRTLRVWSALAKMNSYTLEASDTDSVYQLEWEGDNFLAVMTSIELPSVKAFL